MTPKILARPFLLGTALFALTIPFERAQATTVNFSINPTNTLRFVDESRNFLSDGSPILIGSLSDPSDLSTFRTFAEAAIGSIGDFPGFALSSMATDNSQAASAFDNQQIYLRFNTGPPSNRFFDIFTAINPSNPAGDGDPWFFPVNSGDGTDVIAIDLLALDTHNVLTPTGLRPAFVSPSPDGFGQVVTVGCQLCPEPGTAFLCLMAGTGLLVMRRRSGT